MSKVQEYGVVVISKEGVMVRGFTAEKGFSPLEWARKRLDEADEDFFDFTGE
ncbi:unnamed protein product [marine sediment metagenome]|uniref:Uncharacterized protein n=1 Tax=marine sediment metagenome TaxID=412755 RepID=X1HX38_9ZZZZ